MGKKIVYHGSKKIIQQPLYEDKWQEKDFGAGFYCTDDVETAKEWSCSESGDGYVNQYELELDGLNILNLAEDESMLLNWLALLIQYRKIPITSSKMKMAFEELQKRYLPNLYCYDIVKGYRADDHYFSHVRAYIDDEISLHELMELLQESAEIQYALKSKRAYEALSFSKARSVETSIYKAKRKHKVKQVQGESGRRTLAEAMDYAVHGCDLSIETFMELFITGGIADEFAADAPQYVYGMTGAELVCAVLKKAGVPCENLKPHQYFAKSREYWSGWMLAHYQQVSGISYRHIYQQIPMKKIVRLCGSGNKLSEEQCVTKLEEERKGQCIQPTRLQILRKAAGYSQKELAVRTGVHIRNIQQYEQRINDINKAKMETLVAFARFFNCRIEDLLEVEI